MPQVVQPMILLIPDIHWGPILGRLLISLILSFLLLEWECWSHSSWAWAISLSVDLSPSSAQRWHCCFEPRASEAEADLGSLELEALESHHDPHTICHTVFVCLFVFFLRQGLIAGQAGQAYKNNPASGSPVAGISGMGHHTQSHRWFFLKLPFITVSKTCIVCVDACIAFSFFSLLDVGVNFCHNLLLVCLVRYLVRPFAWGSSIACSYCSSEGNQWLVDAWGRQESCQAILPDFAHITHPRIC